MAGDKEMMDRSQNYPKQLEGIEGIKQRESRWKQIDKFYSDSSLTDKRRKKIARVRARARIQQNYIAAKAQFHNTVSRKEREVKTEQDKESTQRQESHVHVSGGCVLYREESMDRLDREVERITRSLHWDKDEEEIYENYIQMTNFTLAKNAAQLHCKAQSQDSIADTDTPSIPQLPAPSTLVLRPNHEAFYDEGIGAPVARNSTMTLKNRDPTTETKRSCRFKLRLSVGDSKIPEKPKESKTSVHKNNFLHYFLQCLRPQMHPNGL
eukprot:g3520.t1